MIESLETRAFLTLMFDGITLTMDSLLPGDHFLIHQFANGVTATLRLSGDTLNTELPRLIIVIGGVGDDRVDVDSNVTIPVRVSAGDGQDTIVGGSGPMTVAGGAGDDWIIGSHGPDTIDGQSGADHIEGSGGNDTIAGGTEADSMDGGSAWDILSYNDQRHSSVRVSFDHVINDGSIGENDIIVDDSFEECWGTFGNDTIDNRDDVVGDTAIGRVIHGLGGNDLIVGSDSSLSGDALFGDAGIDTVLGGVGNDRLDGGLGADLIIGGNGHDTVVYYSRKTAISVTLDGIANDGEAGEADNVFSIEMVVRSPPVRTPIRAASAIDLLDELR